MSSIVRNLRRVLGFSESKICEATGISISKLLDIEEGRCSANFALVEFFSRELSVSKNSLEILLIPQSRNLPLFEEFRVLLMRLLNGYLRLSLWMASCDDNSEEVPA